MSKWILTVENKTFEFANFNDAVKKLKEEIRNHMEANEDVFGSEGTPFAPGAFFSGKYDEGTISDEEIIAEIRTSMLCSSFIYESAECSKDNAIKSLKGDIHFFGKDEYDGELKIDVKSLPEEVVLDITHYDGNKKETYMRSNAFIFDDEDKEYYFKSHQIITTSAKEENLGKSVDAEIVLRRA